MSMVGRREVKKWEGTECPDTCNRDNRVIFFHGATGYNGQCDCQSAIGWSPVRGLLLRTLISERDTLPSAVPVHRSRKPRALPMPSPYDVGYAGLFGSFTTWRNTHRQGAHPACLPEATLYLGSAQLTASFDLPMNLGWRLALVVPAAVADNLPPGVARRDHPARRS